MRTVVLLALAACSGKPLATWPDSGTGSIPSDGTPAATGTTADPDPTDPGPDPNRDSDGDGLTDLEEEDLGSDPQAADSDGDGYDDGAEVDGNTDPTDADDHPYLAGWPIDACRDEVRSTGNRVGDIADDFALLDQFGETVHLHDFCGQEVLLVSSAMWCGPCQQEAPELQAWYADLHDQGLMVITLLGEDLFGSAPGQNDLETWADTFGLEHPVLSDGGWQVTSRFLASQSFAIPTMHLLGEGVEVLARDTWVSRSTVVDNLP